MCINSWCILIFSKLHNTYIPWERGVSGRLSEFHKIVKDAVKGQLQCIISENIRMVEPIHFWNAYEHFEQEFCVVNGRCDLLTYKLPGQQCRGVA
jgi:hypothetical protein